MTMPGQTSLNNFYQSVRFDNPRFAALIGTDVVTVAMYGLCEDKSMGQAAADRLRRRAFELPEIQRRVLENALIDLGYS